MTITITKTESGFEVKLPFELKDSFKKAIPSAKWNGFKKVWEIGPRSGKKAQIWAEQAQVVVKALDEKKEREATEDEFAEALSEIKALEREILASENKNIKTERYRFNNATKELYEYSPEQQAYVFLKHSNRKELKALINENGLYI